MSSPMHLICINPVSKHYKYMDIFLRYKQTNLKQKLNNFHYLFYVVIFQKRSKSLKPPILQDILMLCRYTHLKLYRIHLQDFLRNVHLAISLRLVLIHFSNKTDWALHSERSFNTDDYLLDKIPITLKLLFGI